VLETLYTTYAVSCEMSGSAKILTDLQGSDIERDNGTLHRIIGVRSDHSYVCQKGGVVHCSV